MSKQMGCTVIKTIDSLPVSEEQLRSYFGTIALRRERLSNPAIVTTEHGSHVCLQGNCPICQEHM